mgnify:CR=1 FL=1
MKYSAVRIDDIFWALQFGRPKKRATFNQIRQQGLVKMKPVFFLSTGRCGTNWFAEYLSGDKNFKVFHEPIPNLGVQGKIVYNILKGKGKKLEDVSDILIKEIFLAAREQHLRYAYKSERQYIETNNHISFFAPILAEIFPEALFVHLYRHPGEFVRSAMRRGFYSDNNTDDIKRIKPVEESQYHQKWAELSQIGKNAWLWNETNLFIEDFKKDLKPERVHSFNFNNLSVDSLQALNEFIGINIKNLKRLIKKRKNVQKAGSFNSYHNWSDQAKTELRSICGDLALKYGYEL